MAKKLLSRDLIVSEAFDMIDEKGLEAFSVRQLAAKLGVQVSSLYNHIENEDDILLEVARRTGAMYSNYIKNTIEGLPLEEATYKAGDAFRSFTDEHRYLYELLLNRRLKGRPEFEKAIEDFTQPIFYLLEQYGVTDKTAMDHFFVAMRVITHGFSFLDSLGEFDGLSIDAVEGYHVMIKSVIDAMKTLGKKD